MSAEMVADATPTESARDQIALRLTHAGAIADELIRADPGGERVDMWWYFQDVIAQALRYIEGRPRD
jgi:hypothetical protein